MRPAVSRVVNNSRAAGPCRPTKASVSSVNVSSAIRWRSAAVRPVAGCKRLASSQSVQSAFLGLLAYLLIDNGSREGVAICRNGHAQGQRLGRLVQLRIELRRALRPDHYIDLVAHAST